jgi:ABC-2 type transport system permease protein
MGGWAAPRILMAIAVFCAFNLLLSSGLRSVIERLLSRRRIRELMALLIVIAAALPRLLLVMGNRLHALGGLGALLEIPGLPWTAAAQAVLGPATVAALLAVVAWALAAGWFGRAQFERGLRYDMAAAQATFETGSERAPWSELFYRFPSRFLPDPIAILIEKELRSLARTPRFRTVFIMGFAFGLMVWLPFVIGAYGGEQSGFLGRNFLTVISVYALTLIGQVTYWNCFGFDRSGATIYFAAPQSIRTVLIGKNLASLVFIYAEALILAGLTAVLRLRIGPGQVCETMSVLGVCSLYMLAFGNVASVRYPRSLRSERVSPGGASHSFQALVFFFYPAALLPVALAYLARYAFASQLAFGLVLAFAAGLGGAFYWIALDSAVTTARKQRERLLHELGGGEGPMVSD